MLTSYHDHNFFLGNNDLKLDEVDLDGDFDPEEHDRKMKELFNENYYEGPEGEFKPEFPDIDEKLNLETNWDDIDPTDKEKIRNEFATDEQHCEDPDFNVSLYQIVKLHHIFACIFFYQYILICAIKFQILTPDGC